MNLYISVPLVHARFVGGGTVSTVEFRLGITVLLIPCYACWWDTNKGGGGVVRSEPKEVVSGKNFGGSLANRW